MKEIDITVNNRTLKCKFGLGFLGECLENLNLNVFEIGKKLDDNPFKWIPTLMFESINYANDNIDFTKEDLINWLDNPEGNKEMAKFLNAFVQSLNKDVPKEDPIKNKKPQPKKK